MKNIFKDLQRKDHKRYLGVWMIFKYTVRGYWITVRFYRPGKLGVELCGGF